VSELRQMSIKFNDIWKVDDRIAKVLSHTFIFHITQLIPPHYLVKHTSRPSEFVHNAGRHFKTWQHWNPFTDPCVKV